MSTPKPNKDSMRQREVDALLERLDAIDLDGDVKAQIANEFAVFETSIDGQAKARAEENARIKHDVARVGVSQPTQRQQALDDEIAAVLEESDKLEALGELDEAALARLDARLAKVAGAGVGGYASAQEYMDATWAKIEREVTLDNVVVPDKPMVVPALYWWFMGVWLVLGTLGFALDFTVGRRFVFVHSADYGFWGLVAGICLLLLPFLLLVGKDAESGVLNSFTSAWSILKSVFFDKVIMRIIPACMLAYLFVSGSGWAAGINYVIGDSAVVEASLFPTNRQLIWNTPACQQRAELTYKVRTELICMDGIWRGEEPPVGGRVQVRGIQSWLGLQAMELRSAPSMSSHTLGDE